MLWLFYCSWAVLSELLTNFHLQLFAVHLQEISNKQQWEFQAFVMEPDYQFCASKPELA